MQNRDLLQLTKMHVFMGTYYMVYVIQINGKLRAAFGKKN